MAYVPKKRTFHISWKLAVPAGIFLFLLAGFFYFQKQDATQAPQIFEVCGWNENKTNEKLMKTYADTFTISDFLYYGESLDLFTQDYGPEVKNDLARKTLQLSNVCDGESMNYTLESSLDRQIDTGELAPGFYELFVNDNQVKKRLIYDEVLENYVFTTVARDGKVKEIELIANPDMLSDEQSLDKNYVFLSVKEVDASSDRIDVMIDPYGNMRNALGVVESGNEGNGLNENEEMYNAALLLKSKLEVYGLRVEITKENSEEVLSYYGEDGRMARAYEKHARYYIELGMNASQISEYRGIEIYHSSYASNTLASSLLYAVKKNTQLPSSNAYTWNDRNEGVGMASQIAGEDGLKIYDHIPALRESGGKATFAARVNELALENESFAKDSKEGMMALSINPIYISNAEDVAYWKAEKGTILDELVKAFVTSIHIIE